jgi:hypothetical protein
MYAALLPTKITRDRFHFGVSTHRYLFFYPFSSASLRSVAAGFASCAATEEAARLCQITYRSINTPRLAAA